MEDKVNTWLSDILKAIDEINLFLPDKKNFIEFQHDLKTKRAIERNVEIIGEAINRILKLDPDYPITLPMQEGSLIPVTGLFMVMILFQKI